MDGRTILGAVGAGLTTFLLVTVAVIEVLDFEFSPLVALPIGLLVGVGVTVGVFMTYPGAKRSVRRAITAYGGFGYAVLMLAAVSYVNLAGLRSTISVPLMASAGVGTTVLLYVGLWLRERRD